MGGVSRGGIGSVGGSYSGKCAVISHEHIVCTYPINKSTHAPAHKGEPIEKKGISIVLG